MSTYRPQLNRLERIWRFVKGKRACHLWWRDQVGLTTHAQVVLDMIRTTVVGVLTPASASTNRPLADRICLRLGPRGAFTR